MLDICAAPRYGLGMKDRGYRNFYGRFKGKALKPSQQRYLNEVLPSYALARVSWESNPEREPIDFKEIYGEKPVWLEIGFGSGEHLHHLAKQYPEIGFIGVEPYLNGVASLLGKLSLAEVDNLKLYVGDARDLMDVLPAGQVERAYLLYPDPWPKARHHRRRFVTQEHLRPLAKAIMPKGSLRIATDIPDYVRQALLEAPKAGFDWLAENAEDWRAPWQGWYSTRYEQKALREGRVPHYLQFERRTAIELDDAAESV